jgi:hypothetical protein
MPSIVYEDPDGQILEYRRHPFDPGVLHVEARALRPDGSPHGDEWFPISERRREWLVTSGSGVLDALGDLTSADD